MQTHLIICTAICGILAIAGCESPYMKPDDRPAMQLKLDEPFELQFGRGSGMAGLDTIVIKTSGKIIVHRRADQVLNGKPFWGLGNGDIHNR